MALPTDTPVLHQPRHRVQRLRSGIAADVLVGVLALCLVAAATLVITWRHWYSFGKIFAWAPPLFGHFVPHFGIGTPVVLIVATVVVARGPELAARLRWRGLALVGYGTAVAWTLGIAMIDGWRLGLANQFTSGDQYLRDVPRITDIGTMLRLFTTHIIGGQPHHWITQVAGHPPGALLVFVWLSRIGLSGGSWAGVTCLLVGCLAAIAVPLTLGALGDDGAARAVLPFTVLFPGAANLGISADGLFTGVTSVAILALAVGAGGRARWSFVWSVAGGILLGCGMFLSYGLVLMAPIALAVCVYRRNWRAIALAAVGAALVVAAFAAAGFWWLDGYHLVVQRYYQDLGRTRPYDYWVWANLAALTLAVGPVLAPALRRALFGMNRTTQLDDNRPHIGRPVVWLVLSAALAVAVADKSGMSKAEVERIWLPFGVWLVSGAALLPPASRRWWLAAQAVTALVVGHLILTRW
ncbi:MAG TPA: hypothetical protein VH333_07230 [Pseudonocardiaceae bacterium]|nr:hypothetical protein [Pseudonocardiaceae bacterium]